MFFAYTGRADAMIRFVQDKQLKEPQLWQLAAEQFTAPVDDADLGWRGEYWGKLMRGACMTWEYTRDAALYQLLADTVDQVLADEPTPKDEEDVRTMSLEDLLKDIRSM